MYFGGILGNQFWRTIKVCFSPNLFPSLKYIFRGGRWSFHGLFRSMMQPWSFSFQSAATRKIKDTSAKHGKAHMEILCFESPAPHPRITLLEKYWLTNHDKYHRCPFENRTPHQLASQRLVLRRFVEWKLSSTQNGTLPKKPNYHKRMRFASDFVPIGGSTTLETNHCFNML